MESVPKVFRVLRRYVFNAATLNSDIKLPRTSAATSAKPKEKAQIVVIGAGLAGLSAAAHLLKNGFKQTVLLEATERLGGRVDSKRFADTYCELGAKWIAVDAKKDSVYEVLTHASGLEKRIRHKTAPMYVNTRGQKLNRRLPELVDMLFKQICSGIEFQEKFIAGELHSLNSVHTYLDTETKKISEAFFIGEERQLAHDIFSVLIKEFGSSLGCCLQHVNIEHITQLPNLNAWPLYVPTGLDNLLGHIAKDIGEERLHIGKPVGDIRWSTLTPGAPKVVGCLDGSSYTADHIVCTLPLGVLKNFSDFLFTPPLPERKKTAIKNIGFGSPIKVYLDYDNGTTPWFKGNLRPLWNEQERTEGPNWTRQIVEISHVPSSNYVLEVAIGGEHYDQIEKLPDADLVQGITDLLRLFFKNPRIPYPYSMLRSSWSSSACYLGGQPYISTNSCFHDVKELSAPLGERASLLFAGDATILNGFGTIDGARLSGIREAERIMKYYERTNI